MIRRNLGMIALLLCLVPSCDPAYEICVKVVACKTDAKIAGARVRVSPYQLEGQTGPDGKYCDGSVGTLRSAFSVEVDKPSYASKTAGPFQPENGSYSYDTQVCLDPAPLQTTPDGGVPERDGTTAM